MKFIRELRMGRGKQFKTGSVVGTYPRPLLILNFDESGLDIIKDPVVTIKPEELESYCKKKREELPPLCVVDFCDTAQKLMTEVYMQQASKVSFNAFVKAVNCLVKTGCPWATVALDSVTGLGDSILSHVAEVNAASLIDARKWAPMVGGKIHQCMGVMTSLQSHVVFICHCSTPQKDELTSQVETTPLVPSQWMRDRIGTLVSQFFYQEIVNGKAIVFTKNSPSVFVKGIGARWPANLPEKCDADFKSIYGKELPV